MKVKAHIRVARNTNRRPMVVATAKPNSRPLTSASGDPLPTVMFAVEFDVADALLNKASEVIAQIKVEQAEMAVQVEQVAV